MDLTEAKNLVKDAYDRKLSRKTRQDGDIDMYHLVPYEMKDYDGEKLKEVDNITLNEPKVFADKVISTTLSSNPQTAVEGERLNDDDAAAIEEIIKEVELRADSERESVGLEPVIVEDVRSRSILGECAERVLVYYRDGELRCDITPLDTRFFTFDYDHKGLTWGNYETTRPVSQIEAVYNIKLNESHDKEMTVCDFWHRDNKVNLVYLKGGQLLQEEDSSNIDPDGNPFIPFAFQGSSVGSSFQGKDQEKYRNEGIYCLNRALYAELNKTATILQTQTRMAMRPGYQLENSQGANVTLPDEHPAKSGRMTGVEIGGGYEIVPTPDMIQATRLWFSMLMSALEKGSLPATDYGSLQFPLPAVAIYELKEAGDRIYSPVFQTLSRLWQQRARIIAWQLIALGGSVTFGKGSQAKSLDTSVLNKPYEIKYSFNPKSPKLEAANYTLASVAKEHLPQDEIDEHILKLDNPAAIKIKRGIEWAEKIDPVTKLRNMAHNLVDAADDGDESQRWVAERLTTLAEQLIKREAMGQEININEPDSSKPNPQALMPLYGGGGGGGRKTKQEAEVGG